MHLIITRPRPESEVLGKRLAAMGHGYLIEPMLTITPQPRATLDLTKAAALLLTSANGARALCAHTSRRDLAVLAVGEATARAAQTAGFGDVTAAGGDVTSLATLVRQRLAPEDGALVHVAGSAVAGDLAGDLGRDGYRVRRAVLYRAEASTGLSEPCRAALQGGKVGGILFFSPRSAAAFVKLLQQDNLADICRDVELFGFSSAVADAAAAVPWKGLNIAAMPHQDALLALL